MTRCGSPVPTAALRQAVDWSSRLGYRMLYESVFPVQGTRATPRPCYNPGMIRGLLPNRPPQSDPETVGLFHEPQET